VKEELLGKGDLGGREKIVTQRRKAGQNQTVVVKRRSESDLGRGMLSRGPSLNGTPWLGMREVEGVDITLQTAPRMKTLP